MKRLIGLFAAFGAVMLLAAPPVMAQQAMGASVRTVAPTYVNGETRPLSMTTGGALRVTSSDAAAATPVSSAATTGATTQAVAIAPHTAATGAIVPSATSAVATSLIVKASAGNLYDWRVTSGASAGYVLVFNSTTVPADGAVTPLDCVVVAANSTVGSGVVIPDRHTTGIVIVFSTTGCFTKTSSATAFIRARAV